ncbi:hypothetical protein QVN60_19165, partial [Yersinia aleksiciae]|uniref:hypothetical protein n=1 Tax=Yersinia aleksiciae TaxID=263819 RepID=UPI0025AB47A5
FHRDLLSSDYEKILLMNTLLFRGDYRVVTKKIKQYSLGKDNLYFFYRSIILPWELEWANQKFLVAQGDLNEYCQKQKLSIKSFPSIDQLRESIVEEFESEKKMYSGILWFVRRESKPKDILRHLRNCFAHGNFTKNQKNGSPCIVIENFDKNQIKAKGFLPVDKLRGLVCAASSCESKSK